MSTCQAILSPKKQALGQLSSYVGFSVASSDILQTFCSDCSFYAEAICLGISKRLILIVPGDYILNFHQLSIICGSVPLSGTLIG